MKPLISFFRKILKLDNCVLFILKLESTFPKLIPLLSNQYGIFPDNLISGFRLLTYPILPLSFMLLEVLFNGIFRLKFEVKVP